MKSCACGGRPARAIKRKAKRRHDAKVNRDILRRAKSRPCVDCGGIFHFSAMDFDHRDQESKRFNLSSGAWHYSTKQILAEIAKCDVVCSNCHRVRTYLRELVKRGQRVEALPNNEESNAQVA